MAERWATAAVHKHSAHETFSVDARIRVTTRTPGSRVFQARDNASERIRRALSIVGARWSFNEASSGTGCFVRYRETDTTSPHSPDT